MPGSNFPEDSFEDSLSPVSSINITPFVDVVLVLLVIFMVTARFLDDSSQGMNLSLPKAQNREKLQEANDKIRIVIAASGIYSLEGKNFLDFEAFKDRLKQIVAAQPHVIAVIAADKNVSYESLVQSMDLMRSLGILSFALEWDPADEVEHSRGKSKSSVSL